MYKLLSDSKQDLIRAIEGDNILSEQWKQLEFWTILTYTTLQEIQLVLLTEMPSLLDSVLKMFLVSMKTTGDYFQRSLKKLVL